MQRHHSITLGGQELTLSLSFETSLKLMEKVASPSFIVETLLTNYNNALEGKPVTKEFEFNERNAVQILEIANEPHECLSFKQMGKLVAAEGFLPSYGKIVGYLQEMVMGKSEELKKEDESGESEGN